MVHDAREAAKDADVIYTDSWMSYHISKDEAAARIATLKFDSFFFLYWRGQKG